MEAATPNPVQVPEVATVNPNTPECHSALERLGRFRMVVMEGAGKILDKIWNAIGIAHNFIETVKFNWSQRLAEIEYSNPFARPMFAFARTQKGEVKIDPDFLLNYALKGIGISFALTVILTLLGRIELPNTSQVQTLASTPIVQPTNTFTPPPIISITTEPIKTPTSRESSDPSAVTGRIANHFHLEGHPFETVDPNIDEVPFLPVGTPIFVLSDSDSTETIHNIEEGEILLAPVAYVTFEDGTVVWCVWENPNHGWSFALCPQ